MTNADEQTLDTSTPDARTPAKVAVFWVSVLVLFSFGIFTLYLIGQADAAELKWTRLVYLYGGVEAIVFAAVGAVFGTSVQRRNVEASEERAKEADSEAEAAKSRAQQAESEAMKGRALRANVLAEYESATAASPTSPIIGTERIGSAETNHGGESAAAIAALERLVSFLRQMDAEE